MNLSTRVVSKKEWDLFALEVHKELFGEFGLDHFRSYDFTILVEHENGDKVAYVNIKELDAESAYVTFGGLFKEYRGYGVGFKSLNLAVDELLKKYLRVGFACRTKNFAMIKMGISKGFEIIGLKKMYGFNYLEFTLERGN